MKRRQKNQGEEDGRRRGKQTILFLFREGEKTNRFFNFARGAAAGLFFVKALGERERASP
jgi:hypothetical protein